MIVQILFLVLFVFSEAQVTIKITKPAYEEKLTFNNPSIVKFSLLQLEKPQEFTFNFQLFALSDETQNYIKVLDLGKANLPVKNEEELAYSFTIPTTDIIKRDTKLRIRITTIEEKPLEKDSAVFYVSAASSFSLTYIFLISAGLIGIVIMAVVGGYQMKQRMSNSKNEVSLSTFDDVNYLKDITEDVQPQPKQENIPEEDKFGLDEEDENEEQKVLLEDFSQNQEKV